MQKISSPTLFHIMERTNAMSCIFLVYSFIEIFLTTQSYVKRKKNTFSISRQKEIFLREHCELWQKGWSNKRFKRRKIKGKRDTKTFKCLIRKCCRMQFLFKLALKWGFYRFFCF